MSRGLGRLSLAIGLLCGSATWASAADSSPSRVGVWALAPGVALGFFSPDDLNRRIELDNLLLATAVEPLRNYKRVSLGARRGLSEAVSLELEFGYYWETVRDGVVTREIDAFPLTLAFAYYPPWQRWFEWSVSGGGGLLVEARAKGEDPLGGFAGSSIGHTVQGALELERSISRDWTVRVRGTLHWSEASNVPAAGENLNLSGGDLQLGLRIYLR